MRVLFSVVAFTTFWNACALAGKQELTDDGSIWRGSAGQGIQLEAYGIYSDRETLAVAGNGTVLLRDSTNQRLLLFDERGRFLKAVGRQGKGPGEFERINTLKWLAKQQIFLVHDWKASRLSMWSVEGGLLSESRLAEFITGPVFCHQEEIFYWRENNGAKNSQAFIEGLNLSDGKTETLLRMPVLTEQHGVHVRTEERILFKLMPWDPVALFDIGSDFYLTYYGYDGIVKLYDLATRSKKGEIRTHFPRVLFDDHAIDEVLEGSEASYAKAVRDHMVRPTFWPSILQIMVDEKDQIWTFGPKLKADNTAFPFEVFDRDGQLIREGSVLALPGAIQNNYLYFLAKDDQDFITLNRCIVRGAKESE